MIGLKAALNLAVASRYGWHRDELYYAIAERHLQGGYVELVVGHIAMPIDNEEPGRDIARCMLRTPLARAWPQIVSLSR